MTRFAREARIVAQEAAVEADLRSVKHVGRSVLLAITVVAAPASVASAAADVTGSVRAIAERAAEVVVEEQTLLEMAASADLELGERAELEARIRTADARGVELLTQLDRLDVELSQATRIGLGELAPVEDRLRRPDVYVPSSTVYDAAVADLVRIAETPDAVTSAPTSSGSPAFGLLAVAAVSLLALGAAALGNSLRREPDPSELEAMAWSDGLTGLANRRKLDADLSRSADDAVETAAIMIDIDRFHELTASYGDALGDEILRRVGTLVSQHVRYDDVVYRSGTTQFCVLLPGAGRDDARDVAARIVGAVRGIDLPGGRALTVTVGVAGVCSDAVSAVRHADEALSAAKESVDAGRDRATAGT